MTSLEVHLVALGPDGHAGEEQPVFPIRHFPCILGRLSDSGCVIPDAMISRRHCAFVQRDGRVWVKDLDSRNGTILNGKSVGVPKPLEDGDQLGLGRLVFQVRLLGAPAKVARREEVAEDAAAADRPKVLVVEDDETTAGLFAHLLESWGCTVQVARDGTEALRAAQEEPPDTVFLDIRLPGMSGIEVARRMRSDPILDGVRLVAVTGDEGATDVLRSQERFAQLLVKPVSPQLLREAIAPPA